MAVVQVEPEEDEDLSLEVTDGSLVVACDFPGFRIFAGGTSSRG